MTSYWWVNHKQTFKHEIEGGYLWSPKIKSNGDRNYFYDTMADAAVGDVVLSYANAKIAYFGIVVEEASTSSVNKYPSTMRQRNGNADK
jgi:putative restriction endonuclease